MLRNTAGWLLHSPARLITVIVLAIALLVAAPRLIPGAEHDPGGPSNAADQTASTTAPSSAHRSPRVHVRQAQTPETGETDGPAEGARPVDRRRAVAATRHFLTAWQTRAPHDRWLRALKPHTTPQLLHGLSMTAPGRVPTAPARTIRPVAQGAYAGRLQVQLTDGQRLQVDVVQLDDHWAVAEIQPTGSP